MHPPRLPLIFFDNAAKILSPKLLYRMVSFSEVQIVVGKDFIRRKSADLHEESRHDKRLSANCSISLSSRQVSISVIQVFKAVDVEYQE